ncbi:MAG: hypothetical protein JNM84_24760, partial [Planctomycetes bacterium]|nr:hypothetical protein [Planctomycetota bacterium]
AHALFLVVGGLSREARRRGLRALVTAALLIGPYLLGVLYLYLGERAGHRDWIQRTGGTPAAAQILATLASFTGLQGPQLRVQRPWIELPALLLVGGALLRTLLALGERERPLPERQRLRLHGLSLVVPPLLLALLSQSKSIYLDRYLLAGLPSAVLLVAYGLAGSGEKRALRTCALVLATAAGVLLPFVTCWSSLRKAEWPAALEELAREARTGDVLLIDGPVDRPERPSEGIDITTYHYYRRALETARGAALPTRVVTLPFDLLRRGEWSGVDESERAELERARAVERALLASEAGTIWVAATLDPWRTPWPDRPLEQTTLWKQLVSRAGVARASTYPRLELWRFAGPAAPSASGE